MQSPRQSEALLGLEEGAGEAEMLATGGADIDDAALLFHHFGRLRRSGLLVAELWSRDRLMATLLPRSKDFDPVMPNEDSGPWQLSRFAYLRRDGGNLVLECPEAPCAVAIENPDLIAWISEAAWPMAAKPGTPKAGLMGLLASLAFLVDPERQESPAELTWEFHDRLFHRRTRLFHDFQPHGGTYRFRDRFPAAPAIRPAYAGESVALPAPLAGTSHALRDVMESRRSNREMGSRPVGVEQVSTLLHRVARVKESLPAPLQDCLLRPYPSGGAIHELEFYLAVGICDGLAPGFYHYRGAEHALTRLAGAEPPAQEMLADCAISWAQPGQPPQCLVVLSSRLPRIAWKYEAIAGKLSHLNAGVALQSLYLVCTDLGLNGSAVGSGRPDLFAAATNNSSWEETSIAEFGFGSRPDP